MIPPHWLAPLHAIFGYTETLRLLLQELKPEPSWEVAVAPIIYYCMLTILAGLNFFSLGDGEISPSVLLLNNYHGFTMMVNV